MKFYMKQKCNFILAVMLIVPSIAKANAFDNELKASNEGSKISTYTVGVYYDYGMYVKENKSEAIKYYYKAALQNYSPAQNNLGWSYRQGLGIKKDTNKAIYWFRLAALQNNALALQNLAEMYQTGEGVNANIDYAESLYILCATQQIDNKNQERETGYNNAIHECRRELGKLYAFTVTNKDKALEFAALWFKLALVKNNDFNDDSEVGVRTRRSVSETIALLKKVEKELKPESKKWVEKMYKSWANLREEINDRTSFPLTIQETECGNLEPQI
jgi:hypothetical protein